MSYLSARPSRDVVGIARQQLTQQWWDTRKDQFDLVVSPIVADEASRGDLVAASKRLQVIKPLRHIQPTQQVREFTKRLLVAGALPQKAADDALHIALAVIHQIDYLLTWNCRHIDNAQTKPLIRRLCLEQGLHFPEICTPEELMGDQENG
ncbi:type II toxin-antitoxin system VapC family toxin [Planctomycetota bacterium]